MKRFTVITFLTLLLLLIGSILSLIFGAILIPLQSLWKFIIGELPSGQTEQLLMTIRLPRMWIAILVGSSLAVAGAIMQSITRNPLASPQTFGTNAGALLAITIGIVIYPNFENEMITLLAIVGATVCGFIVLWFAKGSEQQPVYLALAGMALHLTLISFTQAILLFNERSKETIIFWIAGSIDGSTWEDVKLIWIWCVVLLVLAFTISKALTSFLLGEEIAKGIGVNTIFIRLLASIIVIGLAALSVSVAGAIGFIGLIVPHIARQLVGNDYRVVLPMSALLGATFLVYADVCSRFISYPFEAPVGIVTAIIGVPYFFYLIQKDVRPL